MSENLHRFFEIEFFVDFAGGIDLDSVTREFLFLCIEESTCLSRVRQIPERKHGEGNCATTFDDEQITPIIQASCVDLENTESE
jgi:hypothetical protein